jgi:hypothetical protein
LVTKDAATVTAVVALALGWYAARWRVAENDRTFAKARVAAATRVAWRARRVILVVGFVAFAAVHAWLMGKGR